MDFKTYLKKSSIKIEKEVALQLRHFGKSPSWQHHILQQLLKTFKQSTTGGKYIRGMLVLLGYQLAQNESSIHSLSSWPASPKRQRGELDQDQSDSGVVPLSGTPQNDINGILSIAATFEIIHTSLLAHDDIVDKGILRRGKPSLPQLIGESQAMLLGDMGFYLAFFILAESNFPVAIKARGTSLLSTCILDTIAGEMLDVEISNSSASGIAASPSASRNDKRKEEDVLLIHQLKTAQYSIAGPLMLGALLAGEPKRLLEDLKEFGTALGIAFQIQDDILGVFGDEQQLGKSVTSDSEENKNMLLITYALSHATSSQKKVLHTLYGKKHLSAKELQLIKTVFEQTGSLAYSQQMAQEYIEKAKSLIPRITTNKTMQNLLSEFSDFVIKRSK